MRKNIKTHTSILLLHMLNMGVRQRRSIQIIYSSCLHVSLALGCQFLQERNCVPFILVLSKEGHLTHKHSTVTVWKTKPNEIRDLLKPAAVQRKAQSHDQWAREWRYHRRLSPQPLLMKKILYLRKCC